MIKAGDLVTVKRGDMAVFTVDGLVADASGKVHAALSQDGKGAGCVPLTRLRKVERPLSGLTPNHEGA